MLTRDNLVLLVVDVQEKLYNVMHAKESLLANLKILISGMAVFDVPIMFTEQYPKGLGKTLPQLMAGLEDYQVLEKIAFSCLQEETIAQSLLSTNRKQVLVCGIEAHICVYQTARELHEKGYQVEVVTDAVASRVEDNKIVAVEKLSRQGVGITSTEGALFEVLKIGQGPEFKAINKLVK